MRTNFYPIRQFQTGAEGAGLMALGATGPVGLGLGAAQTALGIVQAISNNAKGNRLMRRRRAYQTPEEIFKILNAVENRATSGYDPGTLSYITGQVDRSFSDTLNAATQLGADPNDLSRLLDQKIQATFKIGAENQLRNMENFNKYLGALETVAANDAAEQKSQQDLIKDELQAASAGEQAGFQNILGGANTALSTISSLNTANLYKDNATTFTNPLTRNNTPASTVSVNYPSSYNLPGIGNRSAPDINTGLTTEQILDLLNKIKIGN